MRTAAKYAVRLVMAMYLLGIAILVFPSFFGIQVLAVTSGSMEPAISVGSVIYAQPTAFEDIQKGDIITFRLENSDTKVTHRVAEIYKDLRCISTKGDANEEPDARPIPYGHVEGVVRCAIPYLGWIAVLLNDIPGKVLLASLFLLLLLLEGLLSDGNMKKAELLHGMDKRARKKIRGGNYE